MSAAITERFKEEVQEGSEQKKARIDQPTMMQQQTDRTIEIPEISLTEFEVKLVDLLRGAAAKAGQGTVLRVAGGWVRDKLLGR